MSQKWDALVNMVLIAVRSRPKGEREDGEGTGQKERSWRLEPEWEQKGGEKWLHSGFI